MLYIQAASVYEVPPQAPTASSQGYDYKPPDGYDPASNPTFPNKLPKGEKPGGYGYPPPDGYGCRATPQASRTVHA